MGTWASLLIPEIPMLFVFLPNYIDCVKNFKAYPKSQQETSDNPRPHDTEGKNPLSVC